MPAWLFAHVAERAFAGDVRWVTGRPKIALLGSLAEPEESWERYADVRDAELHPGDGYEVGGLGLPAPVTESRNADDFPRAWQSLTRYAPGDVIRPAEANGSLYLTARGGVTGISPHRLGAAGTSRGDEVTDGSVTWLDVGDALSIWTSAPAAWHGTLAAKFAVIYDAVSGYLISLHPFGRIETSAHGPFEVGPDPALGWFWLSI